MLRKDTMKESMAKQVTNYLMLPSIIVIAIGDDYRFAVFGLFTKLWLKFQGLFY